MGQMLPFLLPSPKVNTLRQSPDSTAVDDSLSLDLVLAHTTRKGRSYSQLPGGWDQVPTDLLNFRSPTHGGCQVKQLQILARILGSVASWKLATYAERKPDLIGN